MSTLRQSLTEYLAMRRALGFKLERAGLLLGQFVSYVEATEVESITTEVALAWAKLPPNGAPGWWAARLNVVRTFARYLASLDPNTEVPPEGLLPAARGRRATPYLYSEADIAGLMVTARTLGSPLRAATYETLFGLLSVTGLRVGEAIRLDQSDLCWDQGLLTVRYSKFNKSREVPLHASTLMALRAYERRRDEHYPRPKDVSFFVSAAGTRLHACNVEFVFRELVRRSGLQPKSERCRPRIHDLRHTFALRTLVNWYRSDVDVQPHLPLLSTYLGHVDPKWTYWYLSAAPELMVLAANRLEDALGELP